MTPAEREQRRTALELEAAELGLTVVAPTARRREPVSVKLEGLPADVDDVVELLTRRGIVGRTLSEQAKSDHGKNVKQFVTIYTDDPANDPHGNPPADRVLWSPGDDSVPWTGELFQFDDPNGRFGVVHEPYANAPQDGSLPVPLLDTYGRTIGEVRSAEVRDGVLVVAGVVAESQLLAVMEAPRIDSLFKVTSETGERHSLGRAPQRFVSPWSLPAVRLASGARGTSIRVTAPPSVAAANR